MQNIARTISIPKEAACPCGSGNNFQDCCENKKHIYEALIVDELGHSVIYDQTEVIEAVKNINGFIETRINSETAKITEQEALRKLKRLYEKLNTALKPMSRAVSCRAGCGHCCHLLVLTSRLEFKMISEYMSSHYNDKDLLEFKERIHKYKNIYTSIVLSSDGTFSEQSTRSYLSSKVPCAFLDNNRRCMVYEARPFICRKYLVFNSPEVCANPFNKTNQYYSGYHSTIKDAIIKLNYLVYGQDYEYKHLLSWFVGA
jgi:Fe-S-cluster containining protein